MLCRNREESDSERNGHKERSDPEEIEDDSYERNYLEGERKDSSCGRNELEESIVRSSLALETTASMELCAHTSTTSVDINTEADHLISVFRETFQDKQVLAIYLISGKNIIRLSNVSLKDVT